MSNTSIRTKAAKDNTAPKPINSNISNHQQGVSLDTKLSITFDEDIKLGNGFFVISNGLNDTRYIATSYSSVTSKGSTITLDPGNTITLDPGNGLLSNSPYFVQMSAGAVTDAAGNAVAAIMDTSVLTFTTAVAADKTPPISLSTWPKHHAEQVGLDSDIMAYFNETIKAGTGTITISNGQGDTRSIAVNDISQVQIDGGQITINPTSSLLKNSEYYVLADKGAIVDRAGNAYAGTQDPTAFTFKTTSDTVAPLLLRDAPPLNSKIGSLTLLFNQSVKAGSGVITIADSQGNKQSIAIHDTSQVSISPYADTVTLTPAVGLIAGGQYVVQMDSGVLTDRFGNAFTGTQGALSYTVPIPTPPIPIRSTPADDKTQVELNSDITLVFNENVNLSTGHFIISNGLGDTRIIAGNNNSQVSMTTYYPYGMGPGKGPSTDYTRVIINPKEDLLAGSQYFVQMEADAVQDFAGTAVVSVMDTTALNFATVDKETIAPVFLRSTPSENDQKVAVTKSITVTFNEPIKAGSGNFIVSNGLGDTRTIAANDTTQVGIDSSKIYIDPSKDLLWNSTYTLTAENNAIADMQGNSFAGGALHFTTVSDHEAPLRLSSDSFVAVKGDNISLNFNEPIKVGIGKLLLNNGLGDIRTIDMNDPSQVSVDQNYRAHIIVNPTLPLLANSIYSLQIAAGAVTDLAGNAYAGIQDTTEAQFYILPNIKPLELNKVAYEGNQQIARHPVNSNLFLSFSEGIKVGTGQITIIDGQGDTRKIDIHDNSQVKLAGTQLTINPAQDLLSNHHYSVQLDAGLISSVMGNTFAGISNNTTINFDTAGKPPSRAALNPVQEIDHGGLLGIYDNNDVLVFNFDTAVTWNGGFKLAQHSFGEHDVVLSADGLSASVELDAFSTVTTGDLLTLTGLSDVYGNAGDVLFTL